MRKIALTRGFVALVDDEDWPAVSQYKWYCLRRHDIPYAARGGRRGEPRTVYMHRQILAPVPPGMHVDHINHDGLDNRRCNIRTLTPSQNSMNRRSTVYYTPEDIASNAKRNPVPPPPT
jgi:hypothetical protein